MVVIRRLQPAFIKTEAEVLQGWSKSSQVRSLTVLCTVAFFLSFGMVERFGLTSIMLATTDEPS